MYRNYKNGLRNLKGPSGVPLGGCGTGYFEIDPEGRVTRHCLNNIHKSFTDSPAGCVFAFYDGEKAFRLQRGDDEAYKMPAYKNSTYRGYFPTMELSFDNGEADCSQRLSAFSGVIAHDIKNSSLPAVFVEIELQNTTGENRSMSACFTWADCIGRGIRDTSVEKPSNPDGESSEWFDMPIPETFSKGASLAVDGITYRGVKQYTKSPIRPKKATFQNYNDSFMLLCEEDKDSTVTIIKKFDVRDEDALASFADNGKLDDYDENEVKLSSENTAGCRKAESASGVCCTVMVPAGEKRTVRFILTWFMTPFTDEDYLAMNKMEGCDYNKYYHNFFENIEELTKYAAGERENIRCGIDEWQKPLLDSSLPEWLVFKEINSAYTLYTNGVLNKRGNFSTLEGEMGGYGGTMDQKMSSHPFYAKLLPELNRTENRQYANVTGAHGEIQHFDIHYYHGMSDYNPDNRVNPTPAGSMIDNTGSWMVQLWNDYQQTGDKTDIEKYYDIMKRSMDFISGKIPEGTAIPNYNTTYDDYRHPEILIYSATVWIMMLEIAQKWAALMNDKTCEKLWSEAEVRAKADIEKLYGNHLGELGYNDFYAFGCDAEYLRNGGGEIKSSVMFAGAMGGEFISRFMGGDDVVPFGHFVSHMETFLRTSIQDSRDYYAPKVYNIRTGQDMDNASSRCWPFYLDSYGAMAAIQAGFVDDGLSVLEHVMLVDLRIGYMWTQNLWNRGYVTYMTAPVSWFVNDVLSGGAVNIPEGELTLGPAFAMKLPIYYPEFWAELDYRPEYGKVTYKIIKTFYKENEKPLCLNKLRVSPSGMERKAAKTVTLPETFVITEGAELDLSEYMAMFGGVTREKLLKPVEQYQTPKPSRIANGDGLKAEIKCGKDSASFNFNEVNLKFNKENPPAEFVSGKYTLNLTGRILPRFGQKYQLIFEYSGEEDDLTVSLGDSKVLSVSHSIDDVESKQFSSAEGCKLLVVTVDWEADKLYGIDIKYNGNLENGDNILKMLWWSTTQNMGVVIHERLYAPKLAGQWINGLCFGKTSAQIEGDHMAFTRKDGYAVYNDIDFGDGGKDYFFSIQASSADNQVCSGGQLEIRLGECDGDLLGVMEIAPTGDWSSYCEFTTDVHSIKPLEGCRDIVLVFKPEKEFLMNYKAFRLAAAEA